MPDNSVLFYGSIGILFFLAIVAIIIVLWIWRRKEKKIKEAIPKDLDEIEKPVAIQQPYKYKAMNPLPDLPKNDDERGLEDNGNTEEEKVTDSSGEDSRTGISNNSLPEPGSSEERSNLPNTSPSKNRPTDGATDSTERNPKQDWPSFG